MSGTGWRPSAALVRGVLGSAVLLLLAVLFARPDLLVLATPLVVSAVWMVVNRPSSAPRFRTRVLHDQVREGEGTLVRTTMRHGAGVEHAVLAVGPHRWVGFDAARGVRGVYVDPAGTSATIDVPIRSLRWGRRSLGESRLAAASRWGGFCHGPEQADALSLITLPLPGRFDSHAPTPHPVGLVGVHPSSRSGDGSEFSSIRPFAPGDRLRRIQWRVSLRTGSLHVTTAVAEQDSNVVLIVDALADIGGGEDAPSSLDVGVRAAGAVSEHYLHRGDRVGLRVLGPTRHSAVPSGAGQLHLRRVLDALARVTPASSADLDVTRIQFGIGAGAMVVMLSPMLSAGAVSVPVTLASRGLSVIVIDTLPEGLDRQTDRRLEMAWRIRLLEREAMLRRVQSAGVPVVAWRGPGTLDEVLRKLVRRSSRPRLARR